MGLAPFGCQGEGGACSCAHAFEREGGIEGGGARDFLPQGSPCRLPRSWVRRDGSRTPHLGATARRRLCRCRRRGRRGGVDGGRRPRGGGPSDAGTPKILVLGGDSRDSLAQDSGRAEPLHQSDT